MQKYFLRYLCMYKSYNTYSCYVHALHYWTANRSCETTRATSRAEPALYCLNEIDTLSWKIFCSLIQPPLPTSRSHRTRVIGSEVFSARILGTNNANIILANMLEKNVFTNHVGTQFYKSINTFKTLLVYNRLIFY